MIAVWTVSILFTEQQNTNDETVVGMFEN